MELFLWLILTFIAGVIAGGIVFSFSGWKAFFKERRRRREEKEHHREYKEKLSIFLDSHAKAGLITTYDDVENFMKN